MKVSRLIIENFRGIKKAELYFDGHTLLIGGNNVGKSTICEALDLVLGPDRLNRFPPVEEFDFYNSLYLDQENNPIPITVEVILTELSEEVHRRCASHLEVWHTAEKRLLDQGEIDVVDNAGQPCLRLVVKAWYDAEEDEFAAGTYFAHSPDADEGELTIVGKQIKRLFGFLYLRALRTGTRALSLERGSLLDIILGMKGVRTGLWEETLNRLKAMDPPIDHGATELIEIMHEIENRLGEYIAITGQDQATKLHVSKLTREHLRKTLSFFLSVSPDQVPVPFQQVGTGTINTLVLALLSFIAEIKKDNVLFAMEEPEIALPPHTQRRIANYLLSKTTQCFVTTHSPYVIERFGPNQITVLKRDDEGTVTGTIIDLSCGLKDKSYHKYIRRGLSEGMLSNGVIIAEGISELKALYATAQIMEGSDESLFPLDLAGITIMSVDGEGNLSEFGSFFQSLEIPVFAFYDSKNRSVADNTAIHESYDIAYETKYSGMEYLLVNEISLELQWNFLCKYRQIDFDRKYGIPTDRPPDDKIREHTWKLLKSGKGEGRSAELIEHCAIANLPESLRAFLKQVYDLYPPPKPNEPFEEF